MSVFKIEMAKLQRLTDAANAMPPDKIGEDVQSEAFSLATCQADVAIKTPVRCAEDLAMKMALVKSEYEGSLFDLNLFDTLASDVDQIAQGPLQGDALILGAWIVWQAATLELYDQPDDWDDDHPLSAAVRNVKDEAEAIIFAGQPATPSASIPALWCTLTSCCDRWLDEAIADGRYEEVHQRAGELDGRDRLVLNTIKALSGMEAGSPLQASG